MRRPLAPGLLVALLGLPAAAAAQPTATGATPEQLVILRQVLARPELQAGQGRGLLDQALDPLRRLVQAAVTELIRWLLRTYDAGGDASSLATLLVALAIVGLAGAVVVRLARGGLAADARATIVAADGPPRAEAELAEAERLARAGDLRGAVHHRYLAALRRLDELGLLALDQSLTNRELLPRATANPAVAAALAPLVSAFDRLWYGQSECSPAEYADFGALADRLWTTAR